MTKTRTGSQSLLRRYPLPLPRDASSCSSNAPVCNNTIQKSLNLPFPWMIPSWMIIILAQKEIILRQGSCSLHFLFRPLLPVFMGSNENTVAADYAISPPFLEISGPDQISNRLSSNVRGLVIVAAQRLTIRGLVVRGVKLLHRSRWRWCRSRRCRRQIILSKLEWLLEHNRKSFLRTVTQILVDLLYWHQQPSKCRGRQ